MSLFAKPDVVLPGAAALPQYAADDYVAPALAISSGGLSIPGANRLYALPFIVSEATTVDGIVFGNGTSVNGHKFVGGIWSPDGRKPGAKLVQTSELTVGDTNTNTFREMSITEQTLLPNQTYFAGLVGNSSSQLFGITGLAYGLPAEQSYLFAGGGVSGIWRDDFTYNATLPDPFVTSISGWVESIFVWLRKV